MFSRTIKYILKLLGYLLLSGLLSLHSQAATEQTLFFYNPEANINDFRTLRTLMDTYLSTTGQFKFQPFDDKKVFENFLNPEKAGVYLLSSWHYQELAKQPRYKALEPLLVGVIQGHTTYTKVLTVKKNIASLGDLQGKRIASVGNQSQVKEALAQMVSTQQIADSVEILIVPKDIDALMSVLFGMAQGALTARHSLNTLATLNPKKYQLLQPMAETEKLRLPVIAAYTPLSKATTTLINSIEQMSNTSSGQEILGMLGLSGWQPFTAQGK